MKESTHIKKLEESHLPELEKITNMLVNDLDNPFNTHSLFYKYMLEYFDKLNSVVCIVRDDFKVLFINEYGCKKIESVEKTKDEFIDKPCIKEICPMKHLCDSVIWDNAGTQRAHIYKDILSPYSDTTYDVVILPLLFNGTRAIVEIWTEN